MAWPHESDKVDEKTKAEVTKTDQKKTIRRIRVSYGRNVQVKRFHYVRLEYEIEESVNISHAQLPGWLDEAKEELKHLVIEACKKEKPL